MLPSLRIYINSKGLVIPKGLPNFFEDGKFSLRCPFCENSHDGQPLLRYAKRGSTEGTTFTGAYLCWECEEKVQQMVNALDGPPPKSSLFDEMEDSAKGRIELYYKHGKFDSSVDHHYHWHNSGASRICYFCKNIASESYAEIPVPLRGEANHFTGGLVRICGTCQVYMHTNFGHEDQAAPSGVLQRCASCKESYLIDYVELEYRKMPPAFAKTFSELFMCPECAVDEAERASNADPEERFTTHHCDYCTEYFMIDKLLLESVTKKWHYSSKGKLMCDKCYGGSSEGPAAVFTIDNSTYRIYRCENGYEVEINAQQGSRKFYDLTLFDLTAQLYQEHNDRKLFP
jgi:transcription elongation factor Elf1